MNRYLAVALALAATAAWAEERYTNADLDRIYVPGAYTNEDLKALPPIEVQEAPPQPLVGPHIDTTERDLLLDRVRGLEERRAAFADELAYEENLVRRADAPGGNSPDRTLHLGYRRKSHALREALRKEIALLDREIDDVRWQALRVPVVWFR